MKRSVHWFVTATWLASVGGCSANKWSGPDPEDSELLAETFDAMSRDANTLGDGDGSVALNAAAIAVRLGVAPVPLTISVNGQPASYLAFVHETKQTRVGYGTLTFKTLIAIGGTEREPQRVLYVAVPADSAALTHPFAAPVTDPSRVAVASLRDLGIADIYVATTGFARIIEEGRGGDCPKPATRGVSCLAATFNVLLDGELHRLILNHPGQVDPATKLTIQASQAGVSGAVLTFE